MTSIYIIEIKRNSLKYTILVFKLIETREMFIEIFKWERW